MGYYKDLLIQAQELYDCKEWLAFEYLKELQVRLNINRATAQKLMQKIIKTKIGCRK